MLAGAIPGRGITTSPVVLVGWEAEHVVVRGITRISVSVTPEPPDNVDEADTSTGDPGVPETLKQGVRPQVVNTGVSSLATKDMEYDRFNMSADVVA